MFSGAMAELWPATPVRYCGAQYSVRTSGMLVIDLARVERIDAAGLGVLLGLRESARSSAITFKLMNATKRVEEILELTHLQRVFEFCSVRELFCLLHHAASLPSCSADQSDPRMKTTAVTVPWNGQKRFRPSRPISADNPVTAKARECGRAPSCSPHLHLLNPALVSGRRARAATACSAFDGLFSMGFVFQLRELGYRLEP